MTVVQAHNLASIAEAEAANGRFEDAIVHHRQASELFLAAVEKTRDPESKNALKLVADAQLRRISELQYILKYMPKGTESNAKLREVTAKKPQPRDSQSPLLSSPSSFHTAKCQAEASIQPVSADEDEPKSAEGYWLGLEKLVDLLPTSVSSIAYGGTRRASGTTPQESLDSSSSADETSSSEKEKDVVLKKEESDVAATTENSIMQSFYLVPAPPPNKYPLYQNMPHSRSPSPALKVSTMPFNSNQTLMPLESLSPREGKDFALQTALQHPQPQIQFSNVPLVQDAITSTQEGTEEKPSLNTIVEEKSVSRLDMKEGVEVGMPLATTDSVLLDKDRNAEELYKQLSDLHHIVAQLRAENFSLRDMCGAGIAAQKENEALKRSIVVFKEELRNKYLEPNAKRLGLSTSRLSASTPNLHAPGTTPETRVICEATTSTHQNLREAEKRADYWKQRALESESRCEILQQKVDEQQDKIQAWEKKWDRLRTAAKKRLSIESTQI